MEHRTDAELARLAYGRASTEREHAQAEAAARELARRRALQIPPAPVSGSPPVANRSPVPRETEPPETVPREAVLPLAALMLVTIGAMLIVATALTPQPSLSVFDRAATADERALEVRLESFDPETTARFVGEVDDAAFFATLTSAAAEPSLLCIGVAEFGALTIIECLPVDEFMTLGVRSEIPLSPETGGIRIGDGYRYRWGPTGEFRVERLGDSS